MLKKLIAFVGEARQELRRVNWPTRQETVRLTLIVIGMSLAVAAFLGFFDYLFTVLVTRFFI